MRYHTRLCILIMIAFSLFHSSVWAETDTRIDQARKFVKEFMDTTLVPGVAVSVGANGGIIWSEGFGYADVEQRVPVWPAITRFRIGSLSKPMTAVAIAQLYESGKLDLDTPIQKYVPSFPKKQKGEITTRLLAGHLAGIRHYNEGEFLSQKHYTTVIEGLDIFKADTLLHQPGTKYSYSSYGWNLISAVIENVAHQDFLTYMQENVFQPFGMRYTVPDQIYVIVENRTRYYEIENGVLVNAPSVDNSYKWAGGGFLSTSEDLVRLGFAHLDPKFLKSETVLLLWASQKTDVGKETHYGIGWGTRTDQRGRNWVGHTGGSVGGTSELRLYPDYGFVIAVITNTSNVRPGALRAKLTKLFLENTKETN